MMGTSCIYSNDIAPVGIKKLPKQKPSAVWRPRLSGVHDFAPPPHDGLAFSGFEHQIFNWLSSLKAWALNF